LENIYLKTNEVLKQRYPFSLVDRVIEIDLGKSIHGIKNISQACQYYDSESGALPLFFTLELMGQLSEILLRLSYDLSEKKGLLAGVQGFEKYSQIIHCDILSIKNELLATANDIYKTKSAIIINNNLYCQGVFIHAFRK